MQLHIGNKNYSSWSMRPWVLLRQAGIAFEEVKMSFGTMAEGSPFKQAVNALGAAGKVPVLIDGDITVWDSLAICEYVAERFPDRQLWPADARARARARSACAEMHSGFGALRNHCTMNIEAALPDVGAIVWRDQPGVRADVARIEQLWSESLEASGGPFLFGERFTVADAFYAPVCTRFRTYALPLSARTEAYVDAVLAAPGVKAWIDDALAEHEFVVIDEPYRARR
jgi:glutathione S-transferase